jgi:hypothetical protein
MRKRKRDYEKEMEIAFFRSKLQDEIDRNLEIILKPNCYLIDRKIFMRCVGCGQLKERTTQNFYSNHGGKNFKTCRAGYEDLNNSYLRPCIPCTTIHSFEVYQDTDVFVNMLLKQYTKTGLSIEWFYETLKQQQYVGLISGKILRLVPSDINSVGIHKHDNNKEHTPDNCFLEVQELNVCQHQAIPCLFCSWKQLFNFILHQHLFPENQDNSQHVEYMRSQYFVTVKDINIVRSNVNVLVYYKQIRDHHFPII